MADIPSFLELPGGTRMPINGLGTWQASPDDTARAVNAALDAGCRHIDTAYLYGNEKAIGDVLQERFKSGKSKREDIFITTKAAPGFLATTELIKKCFDRSLGALQLDYVDLYLLHMPVAFKPSPDEDPFPSGNGPVNWDHLAAWRLLEQLVDDGKAKAIGLSNFNSAQIEKIHKAARIPISNLQVESHLYFQQKELFQFCTERNITFTAFSPLGSPGTTVRVPEAQLLPGPINEPLVHELAKKYNRTPGQILLRHMLNSGMAVIPKSITPSRIKENLDVKFSMSPEDIASLSNFKTKQRIFNIGALPGVKEHPDNPTTFPSN